MTQTNRLHANLGVEPKNSRRVKAQSSDDEHWKEDPDHLRDYLDLQFIIRFIERIGDHAKNIAQDTVFTESAMDIRHGGDLPESR